MRRRTNLNSTIRDERAKPLPASGFFVDKTKYVLSNVGMSNAAAKENAQQSVSGRIQPLVVLLAAVSAGIIVDRYEEIPASAWLTVAISSFVCWLLLWLVGLERCSAMMLLASAAAIGGAWHHCYWSLYPSDELGRAATETPQPVCVEALVLKSPRRVPAPPDDAMRAVPIGDRTRLAVRAIRVRDGDRWRHASGKAELLVDGHLLGVKAADRVRVFAFFARPSPPGNPGEFDFSRHRRTQRQLFDLWTRHPDTVAVVSRGPILSWRRLLGGIRDRSNDLLHRYLQRRQAKLAAAVLLGAREQLSPDRTEEFFTTGTIHLLAISGLHVGILACGFWWATRLFAVRRRTALLAAAIFVIIYALLTDARPPVTRATILVVVFCVARFSGRHGSVFNTLAAAALVLLAWNPANLFRVGAQLSFLAVATISFFGPFFLAPGPEDPLDRLIARTRPWYLRAWRRFMSAGGSLCAISALIWLAALPLTMYRFHLVSPIALLLNPLVWLPVAIALFSGFGVLLFGWLLPPVGHVCGCVCNASLGALESTVSYAHRVEGSHFWASGPPTWWVIVFYGGLAALVAFPRYRPPRRWCAAILAGWIAVGVCTSVVKDRLVRADGDNRLTCTFLAVGHGACAVLELPDGRLLMCDAGRMGSPVSGARSLSAFLWSRRISHVDAVVLTHADADHYNSLPELFERFSVGVVYVSPFMFEEEGASLGALRDAIEEANVPIRQIYSPDRLNVGGATQIEVLHPPMRGVVGGDNANSIVLAVDHEGKRILLPGDLESPGLDDVLAEEPVDFDVVLTPHHGSIRSVSLAAWSTPEWAIVSGGPEEDNPAVRRAYGEAGGRVLHTAKDGAVRIVIEDGRVDVQAWRLQPWPD